METILIVDDEEPVRRTFREWLNGANLDCQILAAADAEDALQLANQHSVDLAILDWALGAGDDGLQLLQDLATFHPEVVAIMVTGYANQATPLDAMRMGVRDYLDKNHDLSRDSFLAAVRKQLDSIRPAKRMRKLNASLAHFREAVETVLPLVRSTAVLTEPVPVSDAIRALMRFLILGTNAKDAVLLVRHYDASHTPADIVRAYDSQGNTTEVSLVPWSKSLAGSAVSMGQPALLNRTSDQEPTLEWNPFERNRERILVLPMAIGTGTSAVFELFDTGFDMQRGENQALIRSAATVGEELLRQALNQKQTDERLVDALGAAISASKMMEASLPTSAGNPSPTSSVLDHVREGLEQTTHDPRTADATVRLAEAIRILGQKHGPSALDHCTALVQNIRTLLDEVAGIS